MNFYPDPGASQQTAVRKMGIIFFGIILEFTAHYRVFFVLWKTDRVDACFFLVREK